MRRIALAAALAVASPALAQAHAVCGDRVFPATLTLDDPGVGDELSLPTFQHVPISAASGDGHVDGYGYEFDKTITEHFGVSVSADYVTGHSGQTNVNGWSNVDVGFKDEFLCSEANEFMASVGVFHVFPHTGSSEITAGTASSTAPTFFFGKGLGDLPIGYLRPLAITGEVGYAVSGSRSVMLNEWGYGLSLQYSVPYLEQHVRDIGLPSFLGRLTPLVEVAMTSPEPHTATTGLVSPGILYDADTWQLGIEANIPVNAATRQTQHVGFIAQFHLFLDDIFPGSLGKPIF